MGDRVRSPGQEPHRLLGIGPSTGVEVSGVTPDWGVVDDREGGVEEQRRECDRPAGRGAVHRIRCLAESVLAQHSTSQPAIPRLISVPAHHRDCRAAARPPQIGIDAGYTRTVELADRLLSGDVRALARAIRMVEDHDPHVEELLRATRAHAAFPQVVGLTGPPGAGKSSICDGLITRWRRGGETVGIIAVDPSSPFSGGAILGDRVRMQRHTGDGGVYIRSMAARGHLGGLASATREAVRLIGASGRGRCLLETVGVGQSELEVIETADTTVVVTTPAGGDAVQIIKAGILEIADIFVVNKADLTGAGRVVKELRDLAHQTTSLGGWEPPVVLCTANAGRGIDELAAAIDDHRSHLVASGELEERRLARLQAEVEAIVVERAASRARNALRDRALSGKLDANASDPYVIADTILNGHQ